MKAITRRAALAVLVTLPLKRIGRPTFGPECRFTAAFQTLRWHAAKVAV